MKQNPIDLGAFREIVGSPFVRDDPESLSRYAVDGMAPKAVILPAEVDQVSGVVGLASARGLTMVPRGSGSKMAAGNPPTRLDLVIGMERLNRIVDMDTANLTVTVQAGARFMEVQAALGGQENRCYLPHEGPEAVAESAICSERENRGCFIPLMPPFSGMATVGGIIAAGSSGPTRLLYGLPRDLVLGVRYVDPEGAVVGMGGKTVKNVSGYDMAKLMIGSMGTLGILCEMTLRLLPLPESAETCLLGFPDLGAATQFVDWIFGTPLLPAAVELANARAFDLLRSGAIAHAGADAYVVAVAMEGVQEAVARMQAEIMAGALAMGCTDQVLLQGGDHPSFWEGYSLLPGRLAQEFPDLLSVKINYPISCYAELLEAVGSMSSKAGFDYVVLCHAGSGVARIHYPGNPGREGDGDRRTAVIQQILDQCADLGGNLIVERARPELKGALPLWGRLRNDLIIIQRIKEELDPAGLFSPGRFVGGI